MSCLDANERATSRILKQRTRAFETSWAMEMCGSDLRGLAIRVIECGVWGHWTAVVVPSSSIAWPEDEEEEGDGA